MLGRRRRRARLFDADELGISCCFIPYISLLTGRVVIDPVHDAMSLHRPRRLAQEDIEEKRCSPPQRIMASSMLKEVVVICSS